MKTPALAAVVAPCVLLVPGIAAADIEGTMASGVEGQEICIVGNTYVGQDFRDAYERRIRARGYATRIVAAKSDCPITADYVASFRSNGWGRYMSVAMLQVYRDGESIALVRYKGSRHGFKGSVEDVIGKMVDVLLPASASATK
jgi:hypothetical protein